MGQLLEYEKQLRENHLIPVRDFNRSQSITSAKCSTEVADRWASEPPPEPILINEKLCKSASSDFVLLSQSSSRNVYTNQNGKRTMDSPLALPERPRQLMRSPQRKADDPQKPKEDLPSPSTEFSKLDLSMTNPWFDAQPKAHIFSTSKKDAHEEKEPASSSMVENPMFGIFPGPSSSAPKAPKEQQHLFQTIHKTKSDTCMAKKSISLGTNIRAHCKSSFFRCMMRIPPKTKQFEQKRPEPTPAELSRPKLRRLPLHRSHFAVLPCHDEEQQQHHDDDEKASSMDDSLKDSAYGDSLPRSSTEGSSQQSSLSMSLSLNSPNDSPESGFVDNYLMSTNTNASHPVSPFRSTETTNPTTNSDPYRDPERESIGSSSSLEIAVN